MTLFLSMRRVAAAIAVMLMCCFPSASIAATVFVATMRAPSGSTEAGGHLYRVDGQTGKSTLVGRILVAGTQPVGLSGMAFHPKTNALYAITLGINDAKRATLLTVNPDTAEAEVVGRLSRPLTDISFDPMGRLYGWTANTGQLAVVDILTGKVSPIGPESEPAVGGAFAIDSRGKAFVATWAEPGSLDRVDLEAGTVVPGPPVSNLPDVSTLRSMAFSAQGDLFATHSVRAANAASVLLRIDPDTGSAAVIGDIPEDAEAIAAPARSLAGAQAQRWIAYALLAALLLAVSVLLFRTGGVQPIAPR